jgi:probable phosphomutase (TIGR03848 family)
MTVLLLIRHAETDAVGNRITGWLPGVSLTARGQQQAIRLGERLSGVPLRAVYASPLERAIHTAEAAARPHNLQVRISEAVGEVRMGEWSGLSYRELDERPEWRRFNQVRSMTRIPGGELMVETQARMVGELDRLRAAHPDEVFAVVSHGDVIKAAIAYFAGMPLDFLWRFEIDPASVSVIAFEGDTPRILRLNDSEELRDLPLWNARPA